MSINIIQQRLANYQSQTPIEEEQALKEITQEVILMSLSRQDFFSQAEFHGGTALRILYGLQRFSEDLDFALLKPNNDFSLVSCIKNLAEELLAFGYQFEINDRTKANSAIKKAFLKDSSIGKILTLQSPQSKKAFKIKLEIDTNPPNGAHTEIKYLDFPFPFGIRAKNLSSSFAGKLHALLCRKYIKGRDWYDFIWYVSRKTSVNFLLLENALRQFGPWKDQKLTANSFWLSKILSSKINSINWQQAAQDVSRFIKPYEQASLNIWSTTFFLTEVEKLIEYQRKNYT